ncbi:MAG TPA: hypothetical protein PKA16_05355 [Ottowia sp.]|uniref:hypothetical protein n=1 Tax=Ottowia sp. TaxID=1898956 RepID=UPI002B88F033|nr:hypothetical protein [Ottowia sp.]HMN20801.1 hypothetical protein [Ottowia sp.]
MSTSLQWVLALVLLAAIALGAWWLATAERRKRRDKRLPQHLPIRSRPVLSRSERQVWLWLREAFPKHHVMVKMPLTRFTMPRKPEDAKTWFPRLGTLYCTFTLCDELGRVIGCVDVMGERRLPRGNRQLKQLLMSQCHISYWALTPDTLPDPWTIRAEFLGITAAELPLGPTSDWAELQTARQQLEEVLDRNRSFRRSRQADLEPSGDEIDPQRLSTWGQPDSLPMPLEPGPISEPPELPPRARPRRPGSVNHRAG